MRRHAQHSSVFHPSQTFSRNKIDSRSFDRDQDLSSLRIVPKLRSPSSTNMATRPPPSSLQANAFEAASPSSSFDDIDTLVTWPTLEQFMEDLSDLDEQDNSREKLDRQGPSVQDMFAARERDVAASSDMFGNFSRREVLPTRLPTSTYQTWKSSLNLPMPRNAQSSNSFNSVLNGCNESYGAVGGSCASCGNTSSPQALHSQVNKSCPDMCSHLALFILPCTHSPAPCCSARCQPTS